MMGDIFKVLCIICYFSLIILIIGIFMYLFFYHLEIFLLIIFLYLALLGRRYGELEIIKEEEKEKDKSTGELL